MKKYTIDLTYELNALLVLNGQLSRCIRSNTPHSNRYRPLCDAHAERVLWLSTLQIRLQELAKPINQRDWHELCKVCKTLSAWMTDLVDETDARKVFSYYSATFSLDQFKQLLANIQQKISDGMVITELTAPAAPIAVTVPLSTW